MTDPHPIHRPVTTAPSETAARPAAAPLLPAKTRCAAIVPRQTYRVTTPAGREFTLNRCEWRKFRGYRWNRYAHDSSDAAVEAYRAHCLDSGLPFVLVRHRRKQPMFTEISLTVPPGLELDHEERVEAFCVLRRNMPQRSFPAVGTTEISSDAVFRIADHKTARRLYGIVRAATLKRRSLHPSHVPHSVNTVEPREGLGTR